MFEDGKELIPASILHRTSKPVVPRYSPNIKAFHSDRTVAVYQFGCNLVMLIATSVSEASVDLSHSCTLLFTAIAAFFLLAEASLLEAQPPKSLLERLKGRFPLTIGGSKKRFNTNIYCGSRFAGYIGSSNGRQFASGYSIPPPITSRLTRLFLISPRISRCLFIRTKPIGWRRSLLSIILALSSDFGDSKTEIKLNKKVDVIGHHFQCMHRHFKFRRLLLEKRFKTAATLSTSTAWWYFRYHTRCSLRLKNSTEIYDVSFHDVYINPPDIYFKLFSPEGDPASPAD
jgi:hypothetical protein